MKKIDSKVLVFLKHSLEMILCSGIMLIAYIYTAFESSGNIRLLKLMCAREMVLYIFLSLVFAICGALFMDIAFKYE